jgi:putative oxidoreductase
VDAEVVTSLPVRVRSVAAVLVRNETTTPRADVLLVVVRIVLAWIFLYYGAGKLFGAFNGPGLHATALFFSKTAHLHPGGFFAVLGGVIEFGGAIALMLGLGARLAGLALVGDMVMAMITVTWTNGINSESLTPGYELNLALAALALVLVVFGAGRFSLDFLVARRIAVTPRPAH